MGGKGKQINTLKDEGKQEMKKKILEIKEINL